jgi:chemotaxis protein MotB
MGPGGASTSVINLRGGLDAPRSGKDKEGIGQKVTPIGMARTPTEEEAVKIAEAAEKRQLDVLMQDLKDAISKSEALAPFKDQLLLDITSEGLRIQIVDAQNRAMFDSGSAKLKDYTQKILLELSPYLQRVPNRLSITGHTDVTPYGTSATYTNWELSADRANAARRALQAGGIDAEKIARIVGLSSSVLFNKADPKDPINRRVSIIVMTRKAEETALRSDSPDQADAAPPAAAIDGGVKLPPLPYPAGAPRPAASSSTPPAATSAPKPVVQGAAAAATVTS